MLKPNIIFLDIDGPVIDLNSYEVNIVESMFRTNFNVNAIRYLNRLCAETNSRIVTNSTHNYLDIQECTLQDDLVDAGIEYDYFHSDWRTIFPKINYKAKPSSVRGIGRLYAIEDWLERNGSHDWICFDDRKFTELPNLIHIKRKDGIDYDYYKQALDILNGYNS